MDVNVTYNCNCLDGLKLLPNNSVDCCVTSPPYYLLRDFNIEKSFWPSIEYVLHGFTIQVPEWTGCLGLEPTVEMYIGHMVFIFREIRRVLKPAGTLWLNMGDSYYGSCKGQYDKKKTNLRNVGCSVGNFLPPVRAIEKYKPKDLMGIPWLLAFALRADGWYLRQDIIWSKKNPMPECVKDRCTKSHEYLFLLSKNRRYYYDNEAILQPCSPNTHARLAQDIANQKGSTRTNGGTRTNRPMKAVFTTPKALKVPTGWDTGDGDHSDLKGNYPRIKNNESFDKAMRQKVIKRNKRSVWETSTEPFKKAHYATFPRKLIIDCIKAGCPENGIVLDPFMGSGRTAIVSLELNRNFLGYEINKDFIKIQDEEIHEKFGLFKPIKL